MAFPQGIRTWRASVLAVLQLFAASAGKPGLRGGEGFHCPTSSTVSITVSWPPKQGAESYQLEIKAEGEFPSVYQNSAEAHATAIDLKPGTEYTLAILTNGTAHGSAFKCRTADLKPSQTLILPPTMTSPTELSVRLHAPMVTAGITHYEVHWKPSKSSEWSGPVNTTASVVSIADLEPSTEYDIQATAVFGSARGVASDPVAHRTSSDAQESFYTYRISSHTEGDLANLNTASTLPYILKYWLRDYEPMHPGENATTRVSRYCVHRLKLPWADYASCNHQNCTCQSKVDRCINRVALKGCPDYMYRKSEGVAICSCNLSFAKAAVGRTPYYWPPSGFDMRNGTCGLAPVEDAEPTGFLYSFPGEAECSTGRSTQTCSWSSQAQVHSVSKVQVPQELRQQMGQAPGMAWGDFALLATSSW
eukprot:CAMPEP_0197638922 /NCGR_PEP_ID=MMETSP1338-20131121/13704_1 /TAXON_ID=43686 ORGANISM="Pelagodinium beii, Strain RCC1491" /NCGR_SAMPLE_ID=MMETSP1338 /ASSEMBLY_ACC=CAM_ASM_000754 /LENGTH=419 /DNA_ID=CAMNT_0043211585 /DNA_START=34 /DNA_END=1290 /DNA_ORIENTATION=-